MTKQAGQWMDGQKKAAGSNPALTTNLELFLGGP